MRAASVGAMGLLASVLSGACNDGFLGYSNEARCEGEKTRCKAPPEHEYGYLSAAQSRALPLRDLTPLVLDQAFTLECGGLPFLGGAGSTVWVFCLDESKAALRARQYDASGFVAEVPLPAPASLPADRQPTFQSYVGHISTSDGPALGIEWTYPCADPKAYDCSLRELVRFSNDASVPPRRVVLSDRVPATGFLLEHASLTDQGDGYFLSFENGNLSLAHVDEGGELLWLQEAFPEGFVAVQQFARGPIVFAEGKLSVLGELANGNLVLMDADAATGNLTARHVATESESALIGRDSSDRLLVAYTDAEGQLHWLRSQNGATEETTLVRQDYSLLAAIDLDADASGASYLTTWSGDLDAQKLTLCRMDDAGAVACHVAPDAYIGELSIPEELRGLVPTDMPVLLPDLAFVSVSDDGSLYTLGKDKTLQRYRFPEADAQ